MKLEELDSGGGAIPLALIGADRQLTLQLQARLSEVGLLEPPADGLFGPVSLWALAAFFRRTDQTGKTALDAAAARSLLSDDALEAFPLNFPDSLAGQIARAMQASGYWLCRHPDCIAIVYIEGMDADGAANDDAPNIFNDLRLVLRVNRAGNPQIVEAWEATTEPGHHYTVIERLDPRGAARIAFGQYKAWSVGIHMAGRSSAHEALVQTAPIRVHRDLNADFERTNDYAHEGLFGINQHWGYDMPRSNIGTASAGCLIGRTKAGHRAFMGLCRADPRYIANHSYRFATAVMPAQDVVATT